MPLEKRAAKKLILLSLLLTLKIVRVKQENKRERNSFVHEQSSYRLRADIKIKKKIVPFKC